MNLGWDPSQWKTSLKVLLGIATVWPPIYICLFMALIFSFMAFMPLERGGPTSTAENIDLIQLQRRIMDGDLKQLTAKRNEIVARDRVGNREYYTEVNNADTRDQILSSARELDTNGQPRVARIEFAEDKPVSPFLPLGVVILFAAHMVTIVLMMGLMPLYIIFAIKSDRLDQNMKIIWAVLFCMLGMFAMPVYWYLYIWRKSNPASTVESPA